MQQTKATKSQPKRRGRPSQKDNLDLKALERLVSLGLTDQQLAFYYNVNESTINRWKKDNGIMQALKKGKDVADQMVERSLFERACGYTCDEEKVFCHTETGMITTEVVEKHYPPDPVSCIFWLKNRKPGEWREKQEIEIKKFIHESNKEKTDEDLMEEANEILATIARSRKGIVTTATRN